ncbi:TetR/AcrR family transcriptional regulator [Loktanella sp. IMCC34160]|uniref:TetR/AcrR family transcriptional regulator n=1 Tax=Loktanella sp. IMCC34160 TaxID=2510646 RepID=UPI00101C9E52|nr:TetR/AcrR family transcriptional regulator [Loktanella sp. IMCC34160]RYG89995.1 TetR/AcrR family transcriptional regulator [Loktanella sp. IMCC34160]
MTMKDKILDAAERSVRKAGFSEMSFRDLANDVGIKSASVHYHFPTKADLGEALVARYADRFKAELDKIETGTLESALNAYVALYSRALVLNESICLCAIMGAEAIGLPENVNSRTKAFFDMNRAWLDALLTQNNIRSAADKAGLIVSALEGGMIVASASNDRKLFDQVAEAAKACIS